jgi:hypothetical protein
MPEHIREKLPGSALRELAVFREQFVNFLNQCTVFGARAQPLLPERHVFFGFPVPRPALMTRYSRPVYRLYPSGSLGGSGYCRSGFPDYFVGLLVLPEPNERLYCLREPEHSSEAACARCHEPV